MYFYDFGNAAANRVDQREELRRNLKNKLPFAAGDPIPLIARAWAVRGSV
jgi:hypothetical protein